MSGSLWSLLKRDWLAAVGFLLAAVTCSSSLADAPRDSSPRKLTVPPAPQAATPSTESGQPIVVRPCRPDFWIVSTRRCRQHAGKRCVCCGFDHYRYHGDRCLQQQQQPQALAQWLRPNVPVCIVVHGSFTSFDGLIKEGCKLYSWLRSASPNRPLQVIFFTWPSEGPLTGLLQVDIGVLGRRSGFNGIYLAQFVSTLPGETSLSLIGHSHGARTVVAALHLFGGGTVQRVRLSRPAQRPQRMRTVLFAAAIDHDWLNPGERYGRALCSGESVLNIRNRRDLTLKFYPLRKPFSRSALARTGFTRKDLCRMGELSGKVREIDVTELIGRRHYWIYYTQHPEIAAAMAPYLYGGETDTRRSGNKPPSPQADLSKRPVRETFSRIRRISLRP